MGEEPTRRITIDVVAESDPLEGWIAVADALPQPFTGMLELLAVVGRAAHKD